MPEIVLTTLNARYAHASFGLRYLMANLGALAERAKIVEFDIGGRPVDVLEGILRHEPRIVGVGVYIWNVEPATRLVAMLKRVRPEVMVVLGGPEVSYETEGQEIVGYADYVITGEGDLAFSELCDSLLAGRRPLAKMISAELPEFDEDSRALKRTLQRTVRLPYDLYSDEDIAHRVIYVEASRGCPFKCEFCLSSLEVPVRNVPLEAFLAAMQRLLDRGVRHFKFVDRTFNLNVNIGRAILEFFFERYRPGLFLHFEMIPDRLPEALRESIKRFPAGALQFEVGIQTFNEAAAERISRRQDNRKVEENLRFLRAETGVHVHADLIAGLPGEDMESFAAGFDRLIGLGPQEIQVGILKRLRGAPIARHTDEWQMVYSPHAPYEVLQTKVIDFATMQRMRRLARYWDVVGNSGNFVQCTPLIWGDGSPFRSFMDFCDWLFARVGRTHAMALDTVAERMFEYLCERRGLERREVAAGLWGDYQRGGRRERPEFLRAYLPKESGKPPAKTGALRRQGRHLG
jgi:radical SAM superfamily enzyme YgiQ (UPF0313 family)